MQTSQPSLGTITLVYSGYYLATAVAVNITLWALENFGGVVIATNAVGWLPLILGAMFAGDYYGRKVGAKPPQSYSWLAGLMFTLVSFVLSVVLLYLVAFVMGLDVSGSIAAMQAEAGDDGGVIAGIIGVLLSVIWVAQRFMFSLRAGGAVKHAARLAARVK